jgi:serine/threonine protein kinase
VIDFFRENNTVYYVMDFIEGDTLHQYLLRLPDERMDPAEAAELVRKVALALAPVHARNVLHRDLKPANIIRQPNGEPVVLDFGAARAFISDRTAIHSVILTPGYAPPEQYAASGKYGPSIDIYALGAVLYRLLTGQTPTASPQRILEELVPPHTCVPNVPEWVSEATMKAMALKPDDRYAGMAALAEALQFRHEPTAPPAAPPAQPLREEKTLASPEPTVAVPQQTVPEDGEEQLPSFSEIVWWVLFFLLVFGSLFLLFLHVLKSSK